jgi:hypothetical protein
VADRDDPFDFSSYAGGARPDGDAWATADDLHWRSAHPAPDSGVAAGAALSADAGPSRLHVARPPVVLLLAAALASVAGAVTAVLLGSSMLVAGAAWVAAGPIAIGLLTAFTARDTTRRAAALYASPEWMPLAHGAAVALAVAGLLAAAVRVGDHVARL